jgi:hypothetical protein
MIRLARSLALTAILPFALAAVLAGPCGPIPGTRLAGPNVEEPVADWSFVGSGKACVLEVRPADPHSVRASCFARGRTLYVLSVLGSIKRWPAMVAEDPNVRVRIDGKIYPLKAIRITDPAERVRVLSPDDPSDFPSESTWLYQLQARS